MNAPQIARLLIAAMAVAAAGCANGTFPVPQTTVANAAATRPLPFHFAKSGKTYQYVITGLTDGEAVQYDYPKSTQPTGRVITGLNEPQGECTTGKKAFWIVNSGNDDVVEFSYNANKQLRSLTETVSNPSMCAVSSKNGDVAVTFLGGSQVIVFKGGQQSGETTYDLPGPPYFTGYDPKGNLFVDGLTASGNVILLELAAGSSAFATVSLPNTLGFPGSVQWDGTYLAVTDQLSDDVYRYAIAKYVAALRGTVALSGASDCADTFTAQPYIFCSDAGKDALNVYDYPAGGTSIATLSSSMPGSILQVTK
jgi:hypothetical protein